MEKYIAKPLTIEAALLDGTHGQARTICKHSPSLLPEDDEGKAVIRVLLPRGCEHLAIHGDYVVRDVVGWRVLSPGEFEAMYGPAGS